MADIKYIHAADLHLDTPFTGLSANAEPGLEKIMRGATFTALENLATLCEREDPDFVLLAGDIYNQEERSIKAQIALADFCKRMARHDLSVFIIHGNHDPLSSRIGSIRLPDNVVEFGAEPDCAPVTRNGQTIALVHGVSHSRDKESRNLASLFKRTDTDCFQLGLLHCAVQDANAPDRYAPCSLKDLLAAKMDAWALGHIHQRAILNQDPLIAYSGNTQGLHVNETGPRGCYVVDARNLGACWRCEARFQRLGPIQWEKVPVDLNGVDELSELHQKLQSVMEELRIGMDAGLDGLILRLHLEGATQLDSELRKSENIADLVDEILKNAIARPALWIKDIEVLTRKASPIEETLARDDLLGELMRISRGILEDRAKFDNFINAHLAPLFGNSRFARHVPSYEYEQLRKAFLQAEYLCQSFLEKN